MRITLRFLVGAKQPPALQLFQRVCCLRSAAAEDSRTSARVVPRAPASVVPRAPASVVPRAPASVVPPAPTTVVFPAPAAVVPHFEFGRASAMAPRSYSTMVADVALAAQVMELFPLSDNFCSTFRHLTTIAVLIAKYGPEVIHEIGKHVSLENWLSKLDQMLKLVRFAVVEMIIDWLKELLKKRIENLAHQQRKHAVELLQKKGYKTLGRFLEFLLLGDSGASSGASGGGSGGGGGGSGGGGGGSGGGGGGSGGGGGGGGSGGGGSSGEDGGSGGEDGGSGGGSGHLVLNITTHVEGNLNVGVIIVG